MGFVANMKWQFEGDIPVKVWKTFRTKFAKEHAPGWKVKKCHQDWGRNGGTVTVSFHTTSPDTAREISAEQWEFLKATISLLVTKQ